MHNNSLHGAYQLHSSATCALPCCVTLWHHNVILSRGFFHLQPGPSQITYYITMDTLRSPLREEKSCGAMRVALLEPCNTMSAFSLEAVAYLFWTLRINLVSAFLPLTMLHSRRARSRTQGQGHGYLSPNIKSITSKHQTSFLSPESAGKEDVFL